MSQNTHTSASVHKTHDIAAEIVADLQKGTVIALYGDLGSGKTTFSQGLARALGITRTIQSPTFILMRQYEVDHKAIRTLYHLDLYRLESYDQDELGLKDIFSDPDALVVIEWADKMKALLPKHRIDIFFDVVSEDERTIVIDDKRRLP